jgi:predicted DNA-binding protein
MANKPYKVMLPPELVEKLDRAARLFGRKSGNKVAEEIIEQYFDFWQHVETQRRDAYEAQRTAWVTSRRI